MPCTPDQFSRSCAQGINVIIPGSDTLAGEAMYSLFGYVSLEVLKVHSCIVWLYLYCFTCKQTVQ